MNICLQCAYIKLLIFMVCVAICLIKQKTILIIYVQIPLLITIPPIVKAHMVVFRFFFIIFKIIDTKTTFSMFVISLFNSKTKNSNFSMQHYFRDYCRRNSM